MRTYQFFFFIMISCLALCLAGCGGGSTVGVNITATQHTENNVIPVTIDAGPVPATSRAHNVPFVSVKICAPGSSGNCQTIDHVILDTGSTGLRILSSVLPSTFLSQLTQVSVNNLPLAECMHFFDGYMWGTIKSADVVLGGYTLSSLGIQIVGDSTYASPSSCTGTGAAKNTVDILGANGVLGISSALQDCGTACTGANTVYYNCSSVSNCQSIAVTTAQQTQQPVSLLSADNNGTMLQLPQLSAVGSNIAGSLILGIATQTNNTPASPIVLTTTAASNYGFTGTLNNVAYTSVHIDSGSTDWVFDDDGTMAICSDQDPVAPGFYCPTTNQSFSLSIVGANNITGSTSFSIGNAANLFANITTTNYSAFATTGFPASDVQKGNAAHTTFLAGLPFFYGKSVWTALEGVSTTIGTGPYIAYQ